MNNKWEEYERRKNIIRWREWRGEELDYGAEIAKITKELKL